MDEPQSSRLGLVIVFLFWVAIVCIAGGGIIKGYNQAAALPMIVMVAHAGLTFALPQGRISLIGPNARSAVTAIIGVALISIPFTVYAASL